MNRYRQRMRAKGYRQVSFWIPDTRTPEFAAQARQQSLAVANSRRETEDLAFIESLIDWDSLETG
ncbi:MAG: antitoxin MazE family protein [Alphaproteobacteria bacterium]